MSKAFQPCPRDAPANPRRGADRRATGRRGGPWRAAPPAVGGGERHLRTTFNRTAVPLTIAAVLALTAASVVVMLGWHAAADAERMKHLEEKLRYTLSRRMMDHRHGLQAVRGLVLASEVAAGLGAARPWPAGSADDAGPASGPGAAVACRSNPILLATPLDLAFREAVDSLNLRLAFPAAELVGKIGLPDEAKAGKLPVLLSAAVPNGPIPPSGPFVRTPVIDAALARATGLGHSVFVETASGMYLLMPIYRGGVTPVISERMTLSRGWVFMRLDREALFAGLPESVDSELDFRIASSTGSTLFDSRAAEGSAGTGSGVAAASLGPPVPLSIAGRRWTLEAAPSAAFQARPTGDVWLAGLVGAVLACLLAVLQHAQVKLASRAETIARRMTENLRTAALTDRLTGLANRPALLHRVQESLERARGEPGYHHGVLFLDFDRFKIINDSLGHQSGDRLLRAIAERLTAELRGNDLAAASSGRPGPRTSEMSRGAAARFGGDEFIVALENLARPADAVAVAERLLARLAEPYDLGGRQVVSTASIGVVLGDGSYEWAEEMVRDADTAMYEAKAAGRAACVLFDRAMRERVAERLQTETDLRGAAERGEMEVFYQPIMSLPSAGGPPEIHRLEALVRWNHPQRGRLAPFAFIGVAEETGLIQPIGARVLSDALGQLAAWRAAGVPGAAGWKIGVNLARQQLREATLASEVGECLRRHGIDAASLHLEVTETEVMSDPESALTALAAVRALGVQIDMDDFGSGHSSLACLDRFPLDVLKIDRSFVADLQDDPRRVAMLSAVARLAEDLDIDIVAEGIETPAQLEHVARLKCSHAQGYHFSRPLPADEVPAWAAALAAERPLRLVGAEQASEAEERLLRRAA
ncbi:putative bifunctional diguanylate cyclase/phosphodiesterase [Phycisphaera mikurensis]|uniref:Signaling protein n=1 Tax=Phycisphaera mikurensis (strain NBRC 102666 / KCTC 22515 / FYK2301M01) TaxID=1142394 RepID=I0IAP3_PHYMF|nr:EAL domain-containing protein [Phycisphaera mikurensis]MBB6441674.1 putative signal transduction protein with EAL and GGDEF domain [Phycisphaera mikurensis]BAM02331.1 hypothetical protein PSMK_01720 [Phycisphaera mikurensis NBRC 102666]